MSLLLGEIKNINSRAADVLKKADLCTDSDIQLLTREDLQELFPGLENFKLRKAIFKTIHSQKPVDQLLKKMKDFPPESIAAALSNKEVLVDYLHILKDIRSQVNDVQHFLDAQIIFLEEPGTKQPDQNSAACHLVDGKATLMYQSVVSGKTFDADLQLMEKVKNELQDQVQLIENKYDPMITFLFCPIASRVASDVDAAMMDVKDDKPVILVLMHHTHWVKYMPSTTWPQYPKVVLSVNVFFHETVSGLLKCGENNNAVIEIRKEILGRFNQRSDFVSQNAQGSGETPSKVWRWWQ